MEDSHIIAPAIKEYSSKHKLERTLNTIVQDILVMLPEDPFTVMCSMLQKNSSAIYQVQSIQVVKKLNYEYKYEFAIEIIMSFRGNVQKAISFFIPLQSNVYETVTANKDHFLEIFHNYFIKPIEGYNIEEFSNFDKLLLSITEKVQEPDKDQAFSLSNNISISTFLSMQTMSNSTVLNYIERYKPEYRLNEINVPDLGFVLFKAGKTMGAKVKFERFLIFIDNSEKMEKKQIKDILSNLYQAIRKFLTAGKLGENGMRLNPENSYFPPNDSLNDIFKLIENIINEANANGKLYYGIDCNANNYYTEETNLYEMDGFKKPPDSQQLIDFYLKMCNDHPLIKYLEDPIAAKDIQGWSTLLDKFQSTKPDVKIAGKGLFSECLEKLNDVIEVKEKEEKTEEDDKPKMSTTDPNYRSRLINNVPRPEDVKEELTELEKKKIEEEEARKKAEEEEAKRLAEEEEEKKRQEEMKKPGKKGAKEDPKAKKKEDDKKKGNANAQKEEPEQPPKPLLPLALKNVSVRLGSFKNLSGFFEIVQKCKEKELEVTVYDNTNETEQSAVIDIGFGSRVNKIILHGFTLKRDKMAKIEKYLDSIQDLY